MTALLMRDPLAVGDLALSMAAGASNVDGRGDWRTIASVDNLVQALWLRLNTPEGALSELGHPEYGSRLYLLIGQLDTPDNRSRARLYVLRALSREPRVAEILTIQVVGAAAGGGRRLEVSTQIRPVGQTTPIGLRFPIFLEPLS